MKVEVKVPFSVQPVKDILPVSVICNDVSSSLETVSLQKLSKLTFIPRAIDYCQSPIVHVHYDLLVI